MLTELSGWIWFVIPLIGAFFGTLMSALRNNNTLTPPKRNAEGEIELGFLFDVLWGIAGAYISVFVMILSPNGDLGAILFATIGGIGGSNVVLSIVKKYNSDIDDKMEEKLNSSVPSKAKSNSDEKNLDKKSG